MVWDRGSIFLHVCSYCCSCMSPAVLADTPHTDTQQADFKVCISDQPHICFSRSHDSLTYSGTHCCFIIFANSHAGSVFWVSLLNNQYLTCSLSNKGCLACSWVYWFTSAQQELQTWLVFCQVEGLRALRPFGERRRLKCQPRASCAAFSCCHIFICLIPTCVFLLLHSDSFIFILNNH